MGGYDLDTFRVAPPTKHQKSNSTQSNPIQFNPTTSLGYKPSPGYEGSGGLMQLGSCSWIVTEGAGP